MNANAPPNGDYRERYVAFLDLLGFKTLVARAETDPAEKERVRKVLGLMRDSLTQNPRLGLRFTHFSDCIVLSIDRTPAGLMEAFESINVLTSNLLQFDVLVRGGLVAGNAYHDRDFVYGTAVNRAFLLESELAQDPMTLVSDEVIQDARQYGSGHLSWLCTDPAQRQFIHYLRWYAAYRPEPVYVGMVIMDEPAKRVIDFVLGRLISDTGRVLAKAQWLQAYWNETVASNGIFERIDPGVTPRYASHGPTIIHRRVVAGVPQSPKQATDSEQRRHRHNDTMS
jgi:hypothetical protein